MIRFSSAAIIFCAVISSFAFAQDSTPKVQVFGGYSLWNVSSGGLTGPTLDEKFRQNPNTFGVQNTFQGWNAEAQYNVNRLIGIVADFGGRYGKPITTPGDTTASGLPTLSAYSIMAGPAVAIPVKGRFVPFVHALAGWDRVHLNARNITGLLSPVSSTASTYTDFAAALGGGVDCNVSHHFTLRLAQLDWFHTTINESKLYGGAFGPDLLQGLTTHQVNLRFSTGVVVRF